MGMNIGKEVAAMRFMTVVELRGKYAEVTGEKTRCRHKDCLVRRIAWRLQANTEGGISERARRRAAELANGTDVRLTEPKKIATSAPERTSVGRIHISNDNRLPMPGATITREYKGNTFDVCVMPDGFEYNGDVYRTLTAVATAVTGTHWNGYHFFRLGKKGGGNGETKC